jgi:NADH:ubiquinone oxidoreductase subunit 6 (subunit J)
MRRWKADPQVARDAATLLPIVAAVLLLPPFILIFATPARVGGIPLVVVYVFAVWALTVFCAWLIARWHAHQAEGANASLNVDADRGDV